MSFHILVVPDYSGNILSQCRKKSFLLRIYLVNLSKSTKKRVLNEKLNFLVLFQVWLNFLTTGRHYNFRKKTMTINPKKKLLEIILNLRIMCFVQMPLQYYESQVIQISQCPAICEYDKLTIL